MSLWQVFGNPCIKTALDLMIYNSWSLMQDAIVIPDGISDFTAKGLTSPTITTVVSFPDDSSFSYLCYAPISSKNYVYYTIDRLDSRTYSAYRYNLATGGTVNVTVINTTGQTYRHHSPKDTTPIAMISEDVGYVIITTYPQAGGAETQVRLYKVDFSAGTSTLVHSHNLDGVVQPLTCVSVQVSGTWYIVFPEIRGDPLAGTVSGIDYYFFNSSTEGVSHYNVSFSANYVQDGGLILECRPIILEDYVNFIWYVASIGSGGRSVVPVHRVDVSAFDATSNEDIATIVSAQMECRNAALSVTDKKVYLAVRNCPDYGSIKFYSYVPSTNSVNALSYISDTPGIIDTPSSPTEAYYLDGSKNLRKFDDSFVNSFSGADLFGIAREIDSDQTRIWKIVGSDLKGYGADNSVTTIALGFTPRSNTYLGLLLEGNRFLIREPDATSQYFGKIYAVWQA